MGENWGTKASEPLSTWSLKRKVNFPFAFHSTFRTFAPNMEKKRHALRKLLEAVEKELLQKPNRKTLDRLSLLAGFQDWDSFQEALHGDAGGILNDESSEHHTEDGSDVNQ